MATRIRLARRGRKKYARYDVVVADQKAPRDGRFIEKIGVFNPNGSPRIVELNLERALYWVMTGAQPSETARGILSDAGVMMKKHLQVGVNKGAITQEQADAKYQEWKNKKDQKEENKNQSLSQKKAEEQKARLDAETKVNEARKAAIAAKAKPAEEAAPAPAEGEGAAETATEE